MAALNNTEGGQQKTVKDLVCSSDLTAGLHSQLTFISVLDSFLSVTAFLGNALILIALHKESSLHPPSKLFLRCLCNKWSLCWSNCRASLCCLFVVCSKWTSEYLSSPFADKICNKLYLVWSVGRNSVCNKRGQTSRPVVRTEIQETLRSRLFGISRELRTSRSHVTTALASGLQFEVHVFPARPRSRGK